MEMRERLAETTLPSDEEILEIVQQAREEAEWMANLVGMERVAELDVLVSDRLEDVADDESEDEDEPEQEVSHFTYPPHSALVRRAPAQVRVELA